MLVTNICCCWCIKAIHDKPGGTPRLAQTLALVAPLPRGDVQHGISSLNCPSTGRDEVTCLVTMLVPIWRQGWSDLSGQRHEGHPFPSMAPLIWKQGKTTLHSWELGTAPIPGLCSSALPGCPLGNARLVTGSSWQSSVLQTLVLLLPAATCCTWWQLLFLYWNSFLANNLCVTSWEPDLALW